MADRRVHQRVVLALLLGATALVLPLSGAVLYGSADASGSGTAWLFLGAVSIQDFVPLLALVGSLGILVVAGGSGARTGLATFTAGMVLAAGATLALAYFGAAWSLRAHGPFGLDESGEAAGWTAVRVATVASLAVAGALCGWVAAQAGVWIGEDRSVAER